MTETPLTIDEILRAGPVMPVVVIDDPAHAVPLARALVAGGVRAIEITLRTARALEAVRAIAAEVPEAIPGVGTVLAAADLDAAAAAGAKFAVSPGATRALLGAAGARALPYLPAVATASELMAAMEAGFCAFKFFPAAQAGGVEMLKAFAGPFPAARFCPTGGIDAASAPQYLALSNVACVGGSWLAPRAAIEAGDFGRIEALAKAAAGMRTPLPEGEGGARREAMGG
ncbi:MAG TPA: bifunctional 4-hydroxy-2-oxoglutarate aldolase/2-dehydro-3-deoxy-phosphogluconate aldolase [Caulobacteraceae bacterium]|jgi:2-dehydro-3-deoxyphosphogluconate aldolase/(4S)-4-hydroxy-2-oxoglutarate aldolase